MTEYEVKCPQTWAWYTGMVHDYNEQSKKLLIKYPDDWKEPEWLDVTCVRYKYNISDSTLWRPTFNEEVECKARAEEREPYGWWPCKAKKHVDDNESSNTKQDNDNKDGNGELYSVAFIGWGDQHNEILGIEYIRKKSTSFPLSHIKNLYKQIYSVPIELKEWVLSHTNNNQLLETLITHKNISSQIIHITYLEKQNKLLLLGVKRVLITMKDIIFCFFEKQKSLLKLEDRTKKLEEESKRKKEQELKAEKYTFNIHPLLSGYLRGRGGSNIERVKRICIDIENNNISKIIRIEPQNGSCYIAAKDKYSLNIAIDQLQIVCKKVIIPKDEMGQIIGSQGKQIQDIKRKSQVIKVISWFKWPYEFQTLKDNQTHRYRPYYDEYTHTNPNIKDNEQEQNDNNNEDIPDIIKNATIDNIFDENNDIVDLSIGYNDIRNENNNNNNKNNNKNDNDDENDNNDNDNDNENDDNEDDKNNNKNDNQNDNDALVIIGRKSRVELCIFMIEMTLNHFRQITKTRNNVRKLRQKINEIKGNPIPPYNQRDRDSYNRRNRRPYHQRERERERERMNERDEQKDNSPQQQQRGKYDKYDNNKGGGGYDNKYGRKQHRQYTQGGKPRYQQRYKYQTYDNKQYDNKYDNKYQNGTNNNNQNIKDNNTQNVKNDNNNNNNNITNDNKNVKKRKHRRRNRKNTSANGNKNNE